MITANSTFVQMLCENSGTIAKVLKGSEFTIKEKSFKKMKTLKPVLLDLKKST